MMPSVRTLKWIAWSICLAVFMAFGVRNLREPDLWWILRTGEWIVQNFSVPHQDVFSYTFANSEWINIKWLFEVIAYAVQKAGGPEFILIIQVIVNALFFLFAFKIYNQVRIGRGAEDLTPTAGFIFASFIAIIGTEFRMTGRPEMISHLFALVYFYLFLKFRNKPGNFIFWLIPLQILWTNLHEAFGTGLVIIVVYLVADLFDRKYIFRSKTTPGIFTKKLYVAALLAILAVVVNPRGYLMFLQPVNIFSQLHVNKYTTELLPMYSGWFAYHKEIIIAIFIFLTALFVFFRKEKEVNTRFVFRPFAKFGSFYFVFLILFFYLSFSAIRNIPFFILCYMPVLAYLVDYVSFRPVKKRRPLSQASGPVTYYVLVIIALFLYISVVTNFYYRNFNNRERFGFALAEGKNPVGVADYIQKNNLKGRCFSDYLVSSYLMWELRPGFKTFIDLRDLDVFPASFFDNFARIVTDPREFEKADKKYDFNYVVLFRSKFYNIHKYLVTLPGWRFAYADAVSMLFVKNNIPDSTLVSNHQDVFQIAKEPAPSKISVFVSKVFNPFYLKENKEYIDYDMIAADLYVDLGRYDFALRYMKSSVGKSRHKDISLAQLGNIYYTIAEGSGRVQYADSAYQSYRSAVKINPSNPDANKGLAVFEIKNSNWKKAEKYLNKAVKGYRDDIEIYRMLARCQFVYSQLYPAKSEYYLRKWRKYLLHAYRINPEDQTIRYDLGTYYSDQNECKKAEKFLKNLNNFEGMTEEERQKLKFSKQNCGVE